MRKLKSKLSRVELGPDQFVIVFLLTHLSFQNDMRKGSKSKQRTHNNILIILYHDALLMFMFMLLCYSLLQIMFLEKTTPHVYFPVLMQVFS